MSKTDKGEHTARRKPGPEADTLKIEGDWKEAAKRMLQRGKPPAPKKRSKKKASKKRKA